MLEYVTNDDIIYARYNMALNKARCAQRRGEDAILPRKDGESCSYVATRCDICGDACDVTINKYKKGVKRCQSCADAIVESTKKNKAKEKMKYRCIVCGRESTFSSAAVRTAVKLRGGPTCSSCQCEKASRARSRG